MMNRVAERSWPRCFRILPSGPDTAVSDQSLSTTALALSP